MKNILAILLVSQQQFVECFHEISNDKGIGGLLK